MQMLPRHQRSQGARLGRGAADLLRIIADPGTTVFLTVHEGGRRRYAYWQPFDPSTGRGAGYVALPVDECDALHAAGRIVLGDPLVDPGKVTYRVRSAPARSARGSAVRESTVRGSAVRGSAVRSVVRAA
ncbi:hypothetical protein H4K36_34780 [Streptomyces sp. DHE7-1]|uniref:hypothetical protein n=1 Tax=unclassified Streptomyces TaxID=2593676 RepID=UPI0036FD6188|nr:hypothetical protein [Streptomyces sp. DHE7-1]